MMRLVTPQVTVNYTSLADALTVLLRVKHVHGLALAPRCPAGWPPLPPLITEVNVSATTFRFSP